MKNICLFAVRAYQVLLGPVLGGSCRYYPSCSNYAVEAIERHGARHGSWLALRRLLRCHPFVAGGGCRRKAHGQNRGDRGYQG